MGKAISPETIADAARVTVREEGLQPGDDIHASADFRLSVLPVIAERAISSAWSRAAAEATAGAGA